MLVEMKTSLPEYKVGDRIEHCENVGTIKFIGPVSGYPSIWLGIDWDRPDRGRHNGSLDGIKYFTASHEKSGSFVRPEKVCFGQSALDAIRSRYGMCEDEMTAKINEQQLIRFQQKIHAPFLQLVGFDKVTDKQKDFSTLQVVNLRQERINSSGPPLELQKTCPNVKELDLSKNLLASWSVIFDICTQLDKLILLNVSENAMTVPDDYLDYKFPNLKTLICGFMNLDWGTVLKIVKVFPNLEELRAPLNKISDLTLPEVNDFQSLKVLDLEANPIREWSEVCKFGVLPKLEHLILENIGIKYIRFEGSENKVNIFEKLRKLNIINNEIDSWSSIAELNKLKSLEDLRFIRNPILETENLATRFQIIIAKIKNLKILNGTEIKAEERKGAEYDYIKKYGLEWLQVKDTDKRDSFLREHNRYLELLDVYGFPEESELKIPPAHIKSSLVVVNLVCNGKVITKQLPKSLLIQKLVFLVQKTFSLEERPYLMYKSRVKNAIEIPLDDESKEIGYYSIQDQDEIIVKS